MCHKTKKVIHLNLNTMWKLCNKHVLMLHEAPEWKVLYVSPDDNNPSPPPPPPDGP